MQQTFTLPFPPSVNHYWRHVGNKVLVSSAGRKYRDAVIKSVAQQSVESFGTARVALMARLSPPDRRRRDLDNMAKAMLDGLTAANVYDDDSQLDMIVLRRGDVCPDGSVSIELCTMESLNA